MPDNRETILAKIAKIETELDKAYALLVQQHSQLDRDRLKDLIRVLKQQATELREDLGGAEC